MTWEDNVKMVELMNNGETKAAVELLANDEYWDAQTVDIFMNAFDFGESEKSLEVLEPIKHRLIEYPLENLTLRAVCRLSVVQAYFEYKMKGGAE